VSGDPNVRWLVVTNAPAATVERYLYSTAHRVVSYDNPNYNHPTHLVVVMARSNVEYIANYQSDRMLSGLMGSKVCETYLEALDAILDVTRDS
jgi:hypothetical protein